MPVYPCITIVCYQLLSSIIGIEGSLLNIIAHVFLLRLLWILALWSHIGLLLAEDSAMAEAVAIDQPSGIYVVSHGSPEFPDDANQMCTGDARPIDKIATARPMLMLDRIPQDVGFRLRTWLILHAVGYLVLQAILAACHNVGILDGSAVHEQELLE